MYLSKILSILKHEIEAKERSVSVGTSSFERRKVIRTFVFFNSKQDQGDVLNIQI